MSEVPLYAPPSRGRRHAATQTTSCPRGSLVTTPRDRSRRVVTRPPRGHEVVRVAAWRLPRLGGAYRGTSLIRKRTWLGPYRRHMPSVLWGSYSCWGVGFFIGEVPLKGDTCNEYRSCPYGGSEVTRSVPLSRVGSTPDSEKLVFYCRTTSASTAPCTSRRRCCLTHCASDCAPCQPLLRKFSGWIRSPPPTVAL